VNVVYLDSSALLKRVVQEAESSAVRVLLRDRRAAGDEFAASSLAWLEVWRALRRLNAADVGALVIAALSGVTEFPLDIIGHRRRCRFDHYLRRATRVRRAGAWSGSTSSGCLNRAEAKGS
jgi:predicted nucleic acid-binding protein